MAWLKLLPQLVQLLLAIVGYFRQKQAVDLGRSQATAEALEAQKKQTDAATKVKNDTQAAHEAHPDDDGGFDTTFQRQD